jgi:hypothetical protein
VNATHHRLEGLEPDNFLAFLALLGLLRALDTARPLWRARVYWDVETRPLRPVLGLAEEQTQESVAGVAAEGAATLAAAHVFNHKDLNLNASDARAALEGASDPLAEALFDALLSDAALHKDGRIWPTPLCFQFGQGHQHFLERLAAVPAGQLPKPLSKLKKPPDLNAPSFICAALFEPWTRSDPTDSFRWDAAEDRRYALRANDPSGDSAETQHGANRLAAVGLPVLSGAAILRRGEMRFLNRGAAYGPNGHIEISWPIWSRSARLAGVRAILARSELTADVPDMRALAPLGVVGVWRAERISVGKYFNVTPARRAG